MIISDLKHLETISEGTRVVGGFFGYRDMNQLLKQLGYYEGRSTISYAEGNKAALAYTDYDPYSGTSYSVAMSESAYSVDGNFFLRRSPKELPKAEICC